MTTHRTSLLPVVAVILVLVVLSACRAGAPGTRASDFSLSTADGESVTLSSVNGEKGVLLFFFATWCQACARQLPQVRQFADDNGGEQLAVYGVSLREEPGTITDFLAEKEVNFPVLLDADTTVAGQYGVRGIPTLIGIDADGKIVYRAHAMPDDPAALVRRLTRTG